MSLDYLTALVQPYQPKFTIKERQDISNKTDETTPIQQVRYALSSFGISSSASLLAAVDMRDTILEEMLDQLIESGEVKKYSDPSRHNVTLYENINIKIESR